MAQLPVVLADRMRVSVLKPALFGLVILGLWSMWQGRSFVLDAYAERAEGDEIRFAGIDLDVDLTPIDPSPLAGSVASDTRDRVVIPLAFTDDSGPPTPTVAPTKPVAMSGGTASISGVVITPLGLGVPIVAPDTATDLPIAELPDRTPTGSVQSSTPLGAAGGVVRLERSTADGIGSLEVFVGPDGRWSASGLPGGRYRVRAWVPNRFTTDESVVLFLESGGSAVANFNLAEVDDRWEISLDHAGPIYDGLTGSVAVTVTERRVDGQGLVVTEPVPGVTLTALDNAIYEIEGDTERITDARGAVVYRLRCTRVGATRFIVRYREGGPDPDGAVGTAHLFDLPPCITIPPEPVAVEAEADTAQPPSPGGDR